jgi:putative phosphoesterase
VEIAIISDTHMPRGKRRLPDECARLLRRADLIIHAGDLVTLDVLDELRSFGPPVYAVHGNVDEHAVRRALPGRLIVEAAGARLGVVHDAGPARGRLARLRRAFPDADAVVFGHSHIALHERDADGFQVFNPGSPTEKRRARAHTMGVAWIVPPGRGTAPRPPEPPGRAKRATRDAAAHEPHELPAERAKRAGHHAIDREPHELPAPAIHLELITLD